jgi:hypothetical protein
MNFTAAELRELADLCDYQPNCPREIGNALREYADLKEAAEKGVTLQMACEAYAKFLSVVAGERRDPEIGMREVLRSVAPLLALKGGKP